MLPCGVRTTSSPLSSRGTATEEAQKKAVGYLICNLCLGEPLTPLALPTSSSRGCRAQRRSSQAVPAAARLRAGRRRPLRARRRAAPPRMRRHFPSRQGFKPSREGLEMLLREGESTACSRGRFEPPAEQLEPSRGEGVGCAEELLAAANSPFPSQLAEAARAQRRVRNRRDHSAELSWGRTSLSKIQHS